jgi:hypothetical protein
MAAERSLEPGHASPFPGPAGRQRAAGIRRPAPAHKSLLVALLDTTVPRVSPGVRPSSRALSPRRGSQGRKRSQVRDQQLDLFERCLLVLLEVQARPAGSEPAVAVRLLPRNECRQLERLGDGHPANLSCGHSGEDEVVVFQRPPEDRSRMALRGRGCSSPGPRRSRKSRGRVRRRILDGSRGEMSRVAPRSRASPLWRMYVCRQCEAARLSKKIHLSLARFKPSFFIASRRQPTRQNVWSDLTGGSG